ncbi:MAG: hypothetical protein HYY01_06955 [Chloroflexi bacterium]|nr:hypothetical protein [Chloroflexota bacterium]
MGRSPILSALASVLLVIAACGPAATATPVPATPTTVPATSTPVPATATPLPAGVTPQSTLAPTPQPTAAPTRPPESKPKYGGTLRIVRRAEDPAWDFMRYTGGGGNLRPMAHMVFSMLASRVGAPPKTCERGPNPELAESWRWLDTNTLEVKIRQGVRFHDKAPVNGREVTAEDVAYSYRRGFFTYPVRGVKVVADQVKDVVATDRYTVQIQTKTPVGLLPETLSWNYSLLTLARESGGPNESWEDPATSWIGSGPFMFKQHLPGLKTVLVRHPQYWEKGYPYVDTVEHLVMPDRSTNQAALRAGRVDVWDWDVTLLDVDTLQKSSPQLKIQECPEPVGRAPGWVYFKWDEPLWQDIRVRRAAMLAVDRQPIIDTALLGRGASMSPYPPVLAVLTKKEDLSPQAQKYLTHDPAEARRLLQQAGYMGTRVPEIRLVATTRYGLVSPYAQGVEVLQRQWTDVGFKVTVDWQESARYMAGFITGVWPPGFNTGIGLWSAFDSFSLTKFHCQASKADNKAGVCDLEYDALVDQWLATTDPQKNWELAVAIQSMIVERAYGVPGAVGFEFAVSQPWVKDFVYIQYQYPRPFTYVWLDR